MSCPHKPKPSLLKKLLQFKISLIKTLFTVALLVFISAKGPELHANFIRGYVGQKTVMLKSGRSGGSGSYVRAKSGKTFILTNKHVCKISRNGFMNVIDANGKEIKSKIISMSKKYDLCIVEASEGVSGIFIANGVNIGETIGLVGHPKLQPLTLSKGELIGYRTISVASSPDANGKCESLKIQNRHNIIDIFRGIFSYRIGYHYSGQITAYSRGGSSGSPVVNFFGSVIGVLFAGNRQDQFESYIVPLASVKEFLNEF